MVLLRIRSSVRRLAEGESLNQGRPSKNRRPSTSRSMQLCMATSTRSTEVLSALTWTRSHGGQDDGIELGREAVDMARPCPAKPTLMPYGSTRLMGSALVRSSLSSRNARAIRCPSVMTNSDSPCAGRHDRNDRHSGIDGELSKASAAVEDDLVAVREGLAGLDVSAGHDQDMIPQFGEGAHR